MKKSTLFIIVFLISFILIAPFIIKNIMNKSNEENDIDYDMESDIEQKGMIDTKEDEESNTLPQEEITEPEEENTPPKNNTPVKENNNPPKENNTPPKENNTQPIDNNVPNENNGEGMVSGQNQSGEKDYFSDALFIGDSRTVGISEYGGLTTATFFATTGMSVYNIFERNASVPSVGKVSLEQLLSSKQFGKIYIMLGINELGYNMNNTLKKYTDLVEYVKNKQANAIIYIEANLHVSAEKSTTDKTFTNANINKFNGMISNLADNNKIFYLDANEKFDDANGNLNSTYTHDGIHIYAKYYKEWSEWIRAKAIVK